MWVHTPGHMCIQKRAPRVLFYYTPCSFEAEYLSELGKPTSSYLLLLFIYSWGNMLVFLLSLSHLKIPHLQVFMGHPVCFLGDEI